MFRYIKQNKKQLQLKCKSTPSANVLSIIINMTIYFNVINTYIVYQYFTSTRCSRLNSIFIAL